MRTRVASGSVWGHPEFPEGALSSLVLSKRNWEAEGWQAGSGSKHAVQVSGLFPVIIWWEDLFPTGLELTWNKVWLDWRRSICHFWESKINQGLQNLLFNQDSLRRCNLLKSQVQREKGPHQLNVKLYEHQDYGNTASSPTTWFSPRSSGIRMFWRSWKILGQGQGPHLMRFYLPS